MRDTAQNLEKPVTGIGSPVQAGGHEQPLSGLVALKVICYLMWLQYTSSSCLLIFIDKMASLECHLHS
jgi:hypothetical protein